MIDLKKDVRKLVEQSEKAEYFPDKFIHTIEYFHSAFAYILSLIEVNKTDGDPDSFN